MKLLVFGQTGQVARELARRMPSDVRARFVGRDETDLSEPTACYETVSKAQADVVINAAAWTAVDGAETDEKLATFVNGLSPGAMARSAAARNIPFLHISTDYVFDGSGLDPFCPMDTPAPINAYGRSKLAGERAVAEAGGRWLVLRTAWVFSSHGNNFVKTMLRLGQQNKTLSVVSDQVGNPTPAAAVADALIVVARKIAAGGPGGIYHFSGTPEVNWADLARAALLRAGLRCSVRDIETADYPILAPRPLNGRLDCSDIKQAYGLTRPDWREGLDEVVRELLE